MALDGGADPVGHEHADHAPDTQPPTAPTNLTATAQRGPDQPELDGVDRQRGGDRLPGGARGPRESSFTQIGTTTGTTFNDIGRVGRAHLQLPRAGHRRGRQPQPVLERGTGLRVFAVSPHRSTLTFTQTQQFTANAVSVIWSVDGVVGGSALGHDHESTVCTRPPQRRHSHRDGDHVGDHNLRITRRSTSRTTRAPLRFTMTTSGPART